MGGSFGGYMANWVAGHTDRFRAIVTHASLWDLRGFHGVTDHGPWWEQEFGDPYLDPSAVRRAVTIGLDRVDPDADARHPRRARPSRADRRGAPALDRPQAPRRRGEVPLLPGREPLGPQAPQRAASGTRRCSPSSTSTSSAGSGSDPSSSSTARDVDWGRRRPCWRRRRDRRPFARHDPSPRGRARHRHRVAALQRDASSGAWTTGRPGDLLGPIRRRRRCPSSPGST